MTAWERTIQDWWDIWNAFKLGGFLIGLSFVVCIITLWPMFFLGLALRHESLIMGLAAGGFQFFWFFAASLIASYFQYSYQEKHQISRYAEWEHESSFLSITIFCALLTTGLFTALGLGSQDAEYKVVDKIELYDHMYQCRHYEKTDETFCYLEQEE